MTDDVWPERSGRKIVMVLKPEDKEALRSEGPDLLLNKEVYILSSEQRELDADVQRLIEQGVLTLTPGTVWVQNPFESERIPYQPEPEAVEQFALAKYLHFSTLCSHLGAREVEIKQIRYKKGERDTSLSFEGGIPAGGVGGSVDSKELNSFCSQLSLKDIFEGGEPNLEAATKYLQQHRLSNDVGMSGLLDIFRNPNNRIKSRKLTLNLTTETHKNLKVLADLKVPKFLASLQADYDRRIKEKTEYILTTEVEF